MNFFWRITGKVCPVFRAKRVRRFMDTIKPDRGMRILDVGGLPQFWTVPIDAHLTILNLRQLEDYELAHVKPNMTIVQADGTRLPYADGEFDLVFSNSVIEHLGMVENQWAFAREIQRVGKAYWVQTPAREFFIEPHFFTPFIHWFPKRVQRRLLRNFTLWGLFIRPSRQAVDNMLAELRLLNRAEFTAMFPHGDMWVERVLGMPKSYTAFKLPVRAAAPARRVAEPAAAAPATA